MHYQCETHRTRSLRLLRFLRSLRSLLMTIVGADLALTVGLTKEKHVMQILYCRALLATKHTNNVIRRAAEQPIGIPTS